MCFRSFELVFCTLITQDIVYWVINMSLEEHLEKGLFCHCWHTWERVGRPGVANVCKSLQNLAVANT